MSNVTKISIETSGALKKHNTFTIPTKAWANGAGDTTLFNAAGVVTLDGDGEFYNRINNTELGKSITVAQGEANNIGVRTENGCNMTFSPASIVGEIKEAKMLTPNASTMNLSEFKYLDLHLIKDTNNGILQGSIEELGRMKNLATLELLYNHNITGSIETMLEAMSSNGRRSNEIVIRGNGVTTFHGSAWGSHDLRYYCVFDANGNVNIYSDSEHTTAVANYTNGSWTYNS